jgi:hypothetical protein
MSEPKSERQRGSRRQAPVPWVWLGLGVLTTLIGLGALAWSLSVYLTLSPDEATTGLGPTIIQLTAPTVPVATIPVNPPTPTVAPTATTAPTPDVSVAPPEITVGYYVQVVDTGGIGVTVRNGPSTSNQPVAVAAEGSIILVVEGPTPGGAYQWWRVQLADGTMGWAAGDFLRPSAAP